MRKLFALFVMGSFFAFASCEKKAESTEGTQTEAPVEAPVEATPEAPADTTAAAPANEATPAQ